MSAGSARRRLGLRISGAAALLVVLAALSQPWWLAPLISERLSASARRPVHLDAMWVTLSRSLQPVVNFRGIRIDNAPWADPSRPFAVLKAATAVFSWRSLEQRRPVIALLILEDGEVDLERRIDGLRNWRLGRPDDRGPGRFKVLAMQGRHATVRFRHERLDLDLEARATPRQGDAAKDAVDEAMPTQLDIRGSWRRLPFAISATTGEVLTFVETGRTFRLRGEATSGDTRLQVDGRAGDILRDPLFDARVDLVAPSLAAFSDVIRAVPGNVKAVRLAGVLKGEPGRYDLSAIKGRLGSTDLSGELGWKRGEQRDTLRAALTSESASVGDLRSLIGRGPAAAARAKAAAASTAASAPARGAPGPTSAAAASTPGVSAPEPDGRPARAVDAELTFAARRLRAADLPWLQSAQFEASLADGRLTVARFELGIADGRAVGKGTMEMAGRPLRGEVEVDLRGARLEAILGDKAALALVSGTVQGRAQLKASGDSGDALMASAVGTLSASVSGGTISSLLDAKMGLQGGKIIRSMLSGGEPIDLRCAAAVVELGRGAGRIRTLVIDTERTRTTGAGTVDLTGETLDVVLTPEAKQGGLFVLDRSIRLHGPLRKPQRALVARAAVANVAPRQCPAERP